jgi:hypothetical protein
MSTEIAKSQTFEEKMMERIRTSIGELMSDEDLKKLVERGIEKALFTPREEKGAWHTTVKPSIVDECVVKFVEARAKAAVDEWLKTHPEQIEAALHSAVKAGVGGCILQTLDSRFAGIFDYAFMQLKDQGAISRDAQVTLPR